MPTLRSPLFHVTMAVAEVGEAMECLRRLFARPLLSMGHWDVAGRWAYFSHVGDVWVEAISPDPFPSGVRSFTDRFGSHLHSLAWYVTDIDVYQQRLSDAGVRCYDADGALIEGVVPRHGPIPLPAGYRRLYPRAWESAVLFTHFRDSHGMIELCEPSADHPLPPRKPDRDMLVDDDPLGVVGLSHCTIAVRDAEAVTRLWVEVFDGRVLYETANPAVGTHSTFLAVGDAPYCVLELAQPLGDGPARADLDAVGMDILHAVNFRVRDLELVRRHLSSQGFGIEVDTESLVITNPKSTAGARFGFVEVDVTSGPNALDGATVR